MGKSIMISAMASGSGKTTVVCALLTALKNRKLKVAACKCGPDYIDPMFHKTVLGIPSKNLDSFFCDEDILRMLYDEHSALTDITVTEGVMGYYDGIGFGTAASSYEIAGKLGLPVVLVVNAKGMANTLIPLLKGIKEYKKDSHICGVILNNVSKSVYDMMASAIEREVKIAALGYLPGCAEIAVESRHLGLVTPENIADIMEKAEKAGRLLEESVDIDRLLKLAVDVKAEKKAAEINAGNGISEVKKDTAVINGENGVSEVKKIRIAVARDEAFCFYYEDNIGLLEKNGCEIVEFSPLRAEKLPDNIQGLIIGGGYPELYAESLSGNESLLLDIKEKLEAGLPALAECGGFMYLHEYLEDDSKKEYRMVGFIKGKCFKTDHLVRFGYVILSAQKDNLFLKQGEVVKGHEFHYWDSTDNGECMMAKKASGSRKWQCIQQINNVFAGFSHIYYYSNPGFVRRFINVCFDNRWKWQRKK